MEKKNKTIYSRDFKILNNPHEMLMESMWVFRLYETKLDKYMCCASTLAALALNNSCQMNME